MLFRSIELRSVAPLVPEGISEVRSYFTFGGLVFQPLTRRYLEGYEPNAPNDLEAYAHGKSALLALAGPGDVKSPTDGFRCEIKVEILTESAPWPRNPATDRLYRFFEQAGGEVGYPVNLQERGGLSDGNLIWKDVPTLDGLGPWGDNDHCSERSADGTKLPEFVEISGFAPKALLNSVAILKLLESAS